MTPPDDPFAPPGGDHDREPVREDLVATLEAAARGITSDPAFRDQLWEQLMDRTADRQPAPRSTTLPVPTWTPRLDDRPVPPSLARRVRRLPYATVAALLVIGLIAYAAATLSNNGSSPGASSAKDRDPIVGTWFVSGTIASSPGLYNVKGLINFLTFDNGGGLVATWVGGSTNFGVWSTNGEGKYNVSFTATRGSGSDQTRPDHPPHHM